MRTEQRIKSWWFKGSLGIIFSCAIIYAQKPYLETGITGHHSVDLMRSVTDTLDDHFDSATVTLYASPNGGFVGGNSGFGEIAKGQEFDVDTAAYVVEGFIYWFGYKTHQSSPLDSSRLRLRLWNNNFSTTVGGASRLAPGTTLDSADLSLDTLVADTMFAGGINVWTIPPRTVTSNYTVGFTMEFLHYQDTVSLMMSTDGDPPVSQMSWEKWNGLWNVIDNTWGLDIDFTIFPLVDLATASLDDNHFIQGIRYSLYPNPARDWMNVYMDVEHDGEYMVTIHDLHGKLIKQLNLGMVWAGKLSTSIEVYDLPPGTYICTITNGKKGLSKKFIKH